MGWETWVIGTVARGLALGTPLLLGTLGEILAERSGVINLGVEGMMILGAFSGFAVAQSTGNPVLGLFAAAGVGVLASLLHGVASISLRANQYVSGLILSIFGLGLAGFLGRGFVGVPLARPLANITVPGLSDIPILGPMLFTRQSPLLYIGLVLTVLLWLVLYRTRWGLAVRSAGESPATADVLGINVMRVRYLCVALGGALAGLAGGFLSIAYRPSWTEGMTAGMGWIIIALTIFASWEPFRAIAGALFFGALYHLSFRLQDFVTPELLKLMPYALAVVVLALVGLRRSGRARGAPAALGLPYIRGEK